VKPILITPTPDDLAAAEDLLKALLRIDTSNPPGREREAIDFLRWQCVSDGFGPEIVGNPERPNLVFKLEAAPENRKGPPLILSCHVDTVPADPSRWTHPPFSGHQANGYIWGRGALDMKGFAAMAFTVMRLLRRHRLPINRDVIFAAVSDEEAGTDQGSAWLVENRPDLLGDRPAYVINEVGGFTVHHKGLRYYPVQVAEKGIAWLRLTIQGSPGHSSLPGQDNAVALLAEAADKIAKARLPWHPSDVAKRYLKAFAEPLKGSAKTLVPLLSNPATGPGLLSRAISDPSRRAAIEAILRNTATPTRISGGISVNMLPYEASVDIDGRLAPGQKAKYLVSELYKAIGDPDRAKYRIEILRESPAVEFTTETPLYEHIREVMALRDPEAHVVPSVIPGFTDSRNYAKLGAVCYGFYPLRLPPDLDFASLFHGDDERIPVDGFDWGIETLMHLLSRFLTT